MTNHEAADAFQMALLAARVADDLKTLEVRVLKIGHLCGFADYFVICTCQSRMQMRAVAQRVIEAAKDIGRYRLGYEGEDSENWVLLDYGDVVMHLFRPETRSYYNIERLWGDAEDIEWQKEAPLAVAE